MVGAVSLVGGVLGQAVAVLVTAAMIYFIALFMGSEREFGVTFAASLWAYIPLALRLLAQAGVAALRGELIVNQGLSYLASVGDPLKDARSIPYVLLGQVDPFTLWHAVLVYAMGRGLFGFGRNRSVLLAVLYVALHLALQVGTTLLTGLLAGGL
ncbi:MAG: hypothetical protein GX605_12640 [Chloroflexi bacterium]|nr:hypothetical protein [Chloroflexota bacterium]